MSKKTLRDGHKLITCILHKGGTRPVMETLKAEFGITMASFNSARGVGKSMPLALRGIGEQTEKEILTVVVDDGQADEIFDFLYHEAEIDQPHGGLIYMHALQHSLSFVLPDLPEEAATKPQKHA